MTEAEMILEIELLRDEIAKLKEALSGRTISCNFCNEKENRIVGAAEEIVFDIADAEKMGGYLGPEGVADIIRKHMGGGK